MPKKIDATTTEVAVEERKPSAAAEELKREREVAVEQLDRSHLHGIWALTNRELKKWYKAPIQLFMTLVQPVIWLGLFGKALNFGGLFTGSSISIPGVSAQALAAFSNQAMLNTFGTTDYFSFLSVGMMTFVIVFTAMFSGMSVVWDRRFGFLNKLLSTPVGRGAIVMGKILSSVIRSLIQAALVLVIALLLGMDTGHITALGIAGTFTGLFLMTLGLSALFLMLALRSTDWQTQMAIMNLLNLPLLFASNALFPSKLMPAWLQSVVAANPVSYATDIGRQLMLGASGLNTLLFDFTFLSGFAVLFATVGIVMSWRLLTK